MALVDLFLTEAAQFNICISARTDGIAGSGTAQDPYNGSTRADLFTKVFLSNPTFAQEAMAMTETPHHLVDGDVISISGVEGGDAKLWNGTFVIYGVNAVSFKYWMKAQSFTPPEGNPACVRLTFPFDEVMRHVPERVKICIGPGMFQTRGYAANDARGWQPKTGQKIVGEGIDVTVLQLVGAENADQHYHAVGMPITAVGLAAIAPLKHFEISDLTIDCNMDNQSGRPDPGYANVACGAVRVLGSHTRISRVKAINWGTKSLKQGSFVLSVIHASGQPSGGDGNPIVTATDFNGIEDCVAIQPSKNNARETTILHIGGVKNATNHAQGFGTAAYIRQNFVDAQYLSTSDLTHPAVPFTSHLITSKSGTSITGNTGIFIGKRSHFRIALLDDKSFIRFNSPRNPTSRWNGYFPITPLGASTDTLAVDLSSSIGTADDSSFVVMGTEFRGIGLSSCEDAVVENNQIHNCWIGGPYQSPMDDSVSEPSSPPTLAREERLDPLNACHTRSLVVRDNIYRDVAVGPYFNAGGTAHYFSQVELDDFAVPKHYIFLPSNRLEVWPRAPIIVEWKCDQYPNPPVVLLLGQEVASVDAPASREFYLPVPPEFALYPHVTFSAPAPYRNYWRIFGTEDLIIEGNQIYLANMDETEFALKEYPLAVAPAEQKYRAYGLVVGDNGLAGGYAHRQVIVRKNKIGHLDHVNTPSVLGVGAPAGGAMMLAGIKELQVSDNIVEVNARNPLRTYRCGAVRFFNNTDWGGQVRPGWKWDTNGHYDEPETLAEDAFILSLLLKRKRGR